MTIVKRSTENTFWIVAPVSNRLDLNSSEQKIIVLKKASVEKSNNIPALERRNDTVMLKKQLSTNVADILTMNIVEARKRFDRW